MKKKEKLIDVLFGIVIFLGLIALTVYMVWNLPEHMTTWR